MPGEFVIRVTADNTESEYHIVGDGPEHLSVLTSTMAAIFACFDSILRDIEGVDIEGVDIEDEQFRSAASGVFKIALNKYIERRGQGE